MIYNKFFLDFSETMRSKTPPVPIKTQAESQEVTYFDEHSLLLPLNAWVLPINVNTLLLEIIHTNILFNALPIRRRRKKFLQVQVLPNLLVMHTKDAI